MPDVVCCVALMERLVSELGSLLKLLDHETLSPATADKMASVRNVLDSLPGRQNMPTVHSSPKITDELILEPEAPSNICCSVLDLSCSEVWQVSSPAAGCSREYVWLNICS